MRNQNKGGAAGELCVFLTLLLLVILVLRFWIFLIPILSVILIVKMRKRRQDKRVSPSNQTETFEETEDTTDKDWYVDLIREITRRVQNEFPEAKWVWGQPNTKKSVIDEREVYIYLNRAGGYRRGRVIIQDLRLFDIEFTVAESRLLPREEEEELLNISTGETINRGEDRQNYELLAYDWVQSNIMRLNENCNEALGRGEMESIIPIEELPIKESWIHICKELVREGIKGGECIPEGIKIKLT